MGLEILSASRKAMKWFFSSRNSERIMKMKPCILGCMTVAILFGCSVTSVKADDLYPPSWVRGVPGTTYQAWDFGTIANPVVATLSSTPMGRQRQRLMAELGRFFTTTTLASGPSVSSDSIDLYIPNTPLDSNNTKEVWTQITWQPDAGPAPVVTVDYGSGAALYLHFNSPLQWEMAVIGCNLSIWLSCRTTRRRRMWL